MHGVPAGVSVSSEYVAGAIYDLIQAGNYNPETDGPMVRQQSTDACTSSAYGLWGSGYVELAWLLAGGPYLQRARLLRLLGDVRVPGWLAG